MGGSSSVDWDAIRAAYSASEASLNEISRQFGVSTSRISRRALREGWPARQGGTMRGRPAPAGDEPLPTRRAKTRKRMTIAEIRARMLEVLTNQLEQLAAINERHPNDSALNERSARAMATIVNAIDKLIDLEMKGGGKPEEPNPERDEKVLHIVRAELAERLGLIGPI
ncbi:hypothetical protein [Rhodoligotrophos ferricapiens]|uniref:hypothetical protein n=1 Tax=Rhodoligotrophos ferricapiens TaxID=3069264 RepID=UPI00315C82DF